MGKQIKEGRPSACFPFGGYWLYWQEMDKLNQWGGLPKNWESVSILDGATQREQFNPKEFHSNKTSERSKAQAQPFNPAAYSRR